MIKCKCKCKCMCICGCIYIYIYIYVYVCMYIYIYIYIYIWFVFIFYVLLLVFSVICMHQGSESNTISILCMYVWYMWQNWQQSRLWLWLWLYRAQTQMHTAAFTKSDLLTFYYYCNYYYSLRMLLTAWENGCVAWEKCQLPESHAECVTVGSPANCLFFSY